MLEVSARIVELPLATPFTISRGTQTIARNVVVELSHDGVAGMGAAAPSSFYGESAEHVMATVPRLAECLGDDPFAIEAVFDRMNRSIRLNPAAKAAVDMAMWDLAGKLSGLPVHRMLGLSGLALPRTSFTIGIDDPGAMAQRAAEAAKRFSVLKVKLGSADDLEIVKAIRRCTGATIRVDANAAWTAKEAVTLAAQIAPLGVELLEQPVPPWDLDGLKFVRERAAVPVVADESAVTWEDVPRLAGVVDGINIKLMKCGGITGALRMIRAARACGLKIMLGCMVETSISIAAAAQIAGLVDWADLDGNLLLSHDPWKGVCVRDGGELVLADAPGLGVSPAE
ncbi:MAG: dipeptide epimerase [Bacillota bacterium]|nr:dipeptide epimerase [Bacillota bacterium]